MKALPHQALERTVGGTLGSSTVSEQIVAQLSEGLGMSSEKLAGEAGQTTTELPKTAIALTTPLTNGRALDVLAGKRKATLGTISSLVMGEGGGAGGSGSGSGGSGAASGSGSPGQGTSGAGGSTGDVSVQAMGSNVVLDLPR